MYKVVYDFIDLKCDNHRYKVGDKFPYKDVEISTERIEELSTDKNKLGRPLIQEVKKPKKKPVKKADTE